MNNHTYWHKQDQNKPYNPITAWSKPEQKAMRGRLGIIGGQAGGFKIIANGYSVAIKAGVGQVKLCLPDCLKKQIPASITEIIYGASTVSGGLARESKTTIMALYEWASGILLIGECGNNSETAIVYENFIDSYKGPVVITRDAVELLIESAISLMQRPQTVLVLSLSQLQKIIKKIFYNVLITHSMNTVQLVEALHKITITYPVTIAVLHNQQIFIADQGNVTTTPNANVIDFIRGDIAVKMAVYWLFYPTNKLAALSTSLVDA